MSRSVSAARVGPGPGGVAAAGCGQRVGRDRRWREPRSGAGRDDELQRDGNPRTVSRGDRRTGGWPVSTVEATRGTITRHVRAVAAVTALGGLLFGYDTGVVSGALLFLKTQFGGLSSFQQELVTSFLLVGAMVGALAAGRVADRIGR